MSQQYSLSDRPLTFNELIGNSLTIYGRNFLPVWIPFLIIEILLGIIAGSLNWYTDNLTISAILQGYASNSSLPLLETFFSTFALLIVSNIIQTFLILLIIAYLANNIHKYIMTYKQMSTATTATTSTTPAGSKNLFSLIIPIFVVSILIGIPLIGSFILAIFYFLVPVVLVLEAEQVKGLKALGRSRQLVR